MVESNPRSDIAKVASRHSRSNVPLSRGDPPHPSTPLQTPPEVYNRSLNARKTHVQRVRYNVQDAPNIENKHIEAEQGSSAATTSSPPRNEPLPDLISCTPSAFRFPQKDMSKQLSSSVRSTCFVASPAGGHQGLGWGWVGCWACTTAPHRCCSTSSATELLKAASSTISFISNDLLAVATTVCISLP